MKKEHLFFLIFVLAAAIVTGATIGFINSFHYIEKQTRENISQVDLAQQKVLATNSDKQNDSVKNENVNPGGESGYNNDTEGEKVAVTQSPAPVTEQGYLVLSREEKQQIIDMLVSLGATRDGDYGAFIRNFQIEKSLPPTGSLDSLTLNAIINEVTRQRAVQIANG